jgi:uncharacterized protein
MVARRVTPLALLGAVFVVAGLLLLDVVGGAAYTLVLAAAGALIVLVLTLAGHRDERVVWLRRKVDAQDLVAIGTIYIVVVLGFRLAFTVFTTANILGLFLSFAASLLIGVAAPIYYSVWLRGRPLASLGIGLGDWRVTAALALLFGTVQYAITLARIAYPPVETWLPLLVMALVVGVFEAILFRGFIQNRLEASFGLAPAVAVAASLYGLYHVGYGMGSDEIVLLIGLGLVYAVAFRVAMSVFVLWPVLTPLGSLFNQLTTATFTLPVESVFGFADIFGIMAAVIWLARRHERRASAGDQPRIRPQLGRRTIRYVAATPAATIALIYFLIGVGVLTVVTPVDGDQSMLVFGASAGAAFLLGAALLFVFDRRALWIVGAILQLLVVWGYFAVASDRDPSFETWGISLRFLQIPLFAALVYLALRSREINRRASTASI